ncbi:MAG: FAD-dependent thymidylate synthase [Nodosilinea sp.]
MDRFTVEVISQTPYPQQTMYAAMHQDYAEDFVLHDRPQWPSESRCGEILVSNLLKGGRGHYGPLEHPQIVFNVGWFPHSTMQQIRTHRVGVSFDVQCLAGDTEVTFVKTSGSLHKVKIAELYDLWTNGEKSLRERKIRGRNGEEPGLYRRDCKKPLQRMQLRVLNETTGAFEISHIQDVMCSGQQLVYRLTLADGKTLDCTTNHRLFTVDGWQHMGDALGLVTDNDHQVLAMTRNCEVMCNGILRTDALYSQKTWLAAQAQKGLTAREIAEGCDCSVEVICYWAKQHGIKLPSGRQLHSQHQEVEFAQNLALVVAPQNWQDKPKPTGRKLMAHPVKVVQVEFLGMQTTYDLEVAGQWHNFVANGVVVHNSFRYTGQRIVDVAEGKRSVDEVFYLRPLGFYTDRQGKKYEYTAADRQQDLDWCLAASHLYRTRIDQGFAEEHARGLIPFDIRQHWVMSANVRSLMHLLDLRWKADAQLEAQKLCELIWPHFVAWVPAIAQWYEENRLKKARLAP